MAEIAEESISDVSPNITGTGISEGDSPASDMSQHEDSAPAPLWQRLGHASEEDLVQSHTRYRQEVQGSQTEVQRLQREVALRDGRLAELERVAPSRQVAERPAAPAPTYRNQAEAMEAHFTGQSDAMVVYEQEKDARYQALTDAIVERKIFETLQKVTRPSQLVHPVIEQFPALRDLSTPLYKFAYEHYDAYAADPYLRTIFQPDPDAIQTGRSPDGTGSKSMDARVLYVIAKDFAANEARDAERRGEAQRRSATGGGGPNPRAAGPARGTEGPLIYEDEIINDPRVVEAMAAAGRSRDPRTQRKRYWESLTETERRRRVGLRDSGQWTGRR